MLARIRNVLSPLIVCTVFLAVSAAGSEMSPEEVGVPFLRNYPPEEYDAHGQNWAIIQDKNGFMYFGNTDGYVLQYDGVSWRHILVTNGSIVRSLAIDSNGVIYVGAQNEIGYLAPDATGSLEYNSLIQAIDESNRDFGDVWQIHVTSDKLYFSTRKYLFRRDSSSPESTEKFQVWQAETRFQSSFLLPGDKLCIHQMGFGLMQLGPDSLQPVPGGEVFNNHGVYVVIPEGEDRYLVGVRNVGLTLFDGITNSEYNVKADQWLNDNTIYCGIRLKDGNIAIGSRRGGIIIMDQKGGIRTVIDKSAGILDDVVYYIYEDNQGAIWIATNKGIARIEYGSPFTSYDSRSGLEGTVQDIVRYQGKLHVATGYGVYALSESEDGLTRPCFEYLSGLASQCWSLLPFGDVLLVSCNRGVFEYRDNEFSMIVNKSGWQLLRSKVDSNRVFIGLDVGVSSLYKSDDGWVDEERLAGVTAEARTIAEDSTGQLWVGTVLAGVMRLEFSDPDNREPKIQYYNTEDGLPTNEYNLVFKNGNGILLGTGHGVFRYDDSSERFHPLQIDSETGGVVRDTTSYTVLAVGEDQNVWYNIDQKTALARHGGGGSYELVDSPFRRVPDANTYNIHPEKSGVIWFGGTKGIVRYLHDDVVRHGAEYETHIRQVQVNNDSILFDGEADLLENTPVLEHRLSAFRFSYAATYYNDESANRYQYMLDGFDTEWSGWTHEAHKDYTNTPAGKYTFRVRAKNVYQDISGEDTYSFEILPPWYRTWWAYVIMLAIVSICVHYILKILIDRAKRKAVAGQKRIERLRTKIAADLHDDIGSGLTEISIMSEVVNHKLPDELKLVVNKELDIIKNTSHNLISSMSDIVWLVSPQRDSLYDLVSRLADAYRHILDSTNIKFKTENLESLKEVHLKMEYRQHLYFIFKEALNNCLKYSNCTEISLAVQVIKNEITMKLTDDGCGFDNDLEYNGNGLKNMANRAGLVKGVLSISSDSKQGTAVEFNGTVN